MQKGLNKQIGKRIKELRSIKGYSQERLAEAIDIATNSLSYIESGHGFMTLSTLDKICRVLDVEPYEVFKFRKIENKEDMYKYIIKKLNFIKDNDEKLNHLYTYIKDFI